MANVTATFLLLFVEKKDISVTLGWLLIFTFLPWIGFLIYFLFGSTYKIKLFAKIYNLEEIEKSYQEILEENIKYIEDEKIKFNDDAIEDYRDMVELNAKNAASVYSQNNTAKLLIDARAKYDLMFKEISEARESINVLYFIIKGKDESGKQFISLLAEKARQGVEVRLIYDTLGCVATTRRDFKKLIDAGGMVYGFMPSIMKTLLNCNYRMHRKMVIIDGEIAYTGGINIGDDYLGLDKSRTPWRDTSIRLTGTSVQSVQLRFLSDWAYLDKQISKRKAYPIKVDDQKHLRMYFKNPEERGKVGVQILNSGPDSDYTTIKDSYLKMITSAKKYLYIQTPYLVPDETLLSALRIASHSGVDVRIMIPGIPDKKFVYYVTLSYVEELLKNGIKIYTHQGFLHSKTFVIDDCISSVGTANFDIRSFNLNYEMNAMVYDSKFATECKETFLYDISMSKELVLESYRKRSRIQKTGESFWRLVAPLI